MANREGMRFLRFTVFATLLAIPLSKVLPRGQDHGHGADNRPGTPPLGKVDHTTQDDGINLAPGVGVGIFAGKPISLLAADHQSERRLSDEGPQFGNAYHMSAFQITGFVKGGWPLAIDYESEAGTFAVLTITTRGDIPYSIELPAKQTTRHIEIFRIPEFVAKEREIADFTIRATASKKDSQFAYFRVYGFACGAKAVGSIAIDQLTFGPNSINASQSQTQFGFHTHTAFDRTQAEFLEVVLVNHCFEGRQVDAKKINKRILSDQRFSDTWNATKATPGQIQFRVRGWMTADHGGDWVTAYSPDLVLKQ